jgi:vacuolar-type H+-ATPase subunit I/STV1
MSDKIARDVVDSLSDAFDHLDAARASLERTKAAIAEREAERIKALEEALAKDRGGNAG